MNIIIGAKKTLHSELIDGFKKYSEAETGKCNGKKKICKLLTSHISNNKQSAPEVFQFGKIRK